MVRKAFFVAVKFLGLGSKIKAVILNVIFFINVKNPFIIK